MKAVGAVLLSTLMAWAWASYGAPGFTLVAFTAFCG